MFASELFRLKVRRVLSLCPWAKKLQGKGPFAAQHGTGGDDRFAEMTCRRTTAHIQPISSAPCRRSGTLFRIMAMVCYSVTRYLHRRDESKGNTYLTGRLRLYSLGVLVSGKWAAFPTVQERGEWRIWNQ
jgi:hypothetical protein